MFLGCFSTHTQKHTVQKIDKADDGWHVSCLNFVDIVVPVLVKTGSS